MKILQVIPYFFLSWSDTPVELVHELSKNLIKRGHKVTILTTDTFNKSSCCKSEALRISRIDNIDVYEFESTHETLGMHISPRMVSALDQLVQSFDVIHLHEYPTFQNLIVSHYARKYKVPYVIQTHASLANSSYNNLAKILLRKIFDAIIGYRLLNGASRAMALNLTEKQQLINARVDPSKIDIVPNGIDFGEYLELPRIGLFREKHGISNNVKIVLYVGRLDKSKRIDLLIKAFDLVVKKKRNSKLVIIGKDYGALGSLKDLAGHLGIEGDIMFTGFLKKHEKIEALVDSDVFVTPCFYGFPRTFLEACACGLPIITTDKGDRLDWIHNQVGYVARFDERDLSDAILKILIDEETKKLFSQNCRKSAQEEFDWHIVSRKIEDVYIRSKPKL